MNVASDIGSLPSNKKPKGGGSVNLWEHVSLFAEKLAPADSRGVEHILA